MKDDIVLHQSGTRVTDSIIHVYNILRHEVTSQDSWPENKILCKQLGVVETKCSPRRLFSNEKCIVSTTIVP